MANFPNYVWVSVPTPLGLQMIAYPTSCIPQAFNMVNGMYPQSYKSKRNSQHMCQHCGHSFTRRGNLERHMKLHFGIRPFQCAECRKKFSTKSNLKTHSRVHAKPPSVICEFCGREFRRKAFLEKHEVKHIEGGDEKKEKFVKQAKLEQESFEKNRQKVLQGISSKDDQTLELTNGIKQTEKPEPQKNIKASQPTDSSTSRTPKVVPGPAQFSDSVRSKESDLYWYLPKPSAGGLQCTSSPSPPPRSPWIQSPLSPQPNHHKFANSPRPYSPQPNHHIVANSPRPYSPRPNRHKFASLRSCSPRRRSPRSYSPLPRSPHTYSSLPRPRTTQPRSPKPRRRKQNAYLSVPERIEFACKN